MSDVVIHVENLSKHYRLGTIGGATLKEDMQRWWAKLRGLPDPLAPLDGQGKPDGSDLWALRDVTFEVKRGEVLGIIGRNGAGKSTLLKILSRTTAPTSGRAVVKGRIGSLLEVGTGFHPELTGRENIYLNGSILGMKKAEIDRKIDEIIDFSGVERFIDTPVKRYSSGMYVRLAFSVAAHLEPDVLVLDEVLAVGDAHFQKKCMGKMEEVGRHGRTILFVSHNMAMISNLCRTGIVMDSGRVEFRGPVSDAVVRYYQANNRRDTAGFKEFTSQRAQLLGAELVGLGSSSDITIHDELTVRMVYRIKEPMDGKFVPNFHFFTADGSYAFVSSAPGVNQQTPGEYSADCTLPASLLNEGGYFVGVCLTSYPEGKPYEVEFFDRNALTFNVIDPMDERSVRYGYGGPIPGAVRPRLQWKVSKAL